MKFLKYVLPMVLVVALLVSGTMSASAYTTYATYTIDNDDAQGYSNDRYGFETKISGSTLFYKDARTQSCNMNGSTYYYNFPSYLRYTPIFATISAYLYHANFTDPRAAYYINDYSSSASSLAGYINQNTAPAGWSQIGTADTGIRHAEGWYTTRRVELWASTRGSSYTCGADAIKVALQY